MTLFVELSLLVVVATLVSLVMKLLKQPLVVGYIAAGILVGPYAFNIIQSYEEMELFSKIGVAILLFIVGLTLNPDVMREVGRTSVVTGIGQVLFTSLVGFLIVRALGFETLTAFYIAVALTFSSTIIILKLLSDRGDTGKLYGKISIGFLLVQDVIASILILIITILGAAAITAPAIFSGAVASEISVLLIKGALAVILLYLVSRYVLPGLSKFVAGYQEVLFIFSLAWGLGISSLFHLLGFSIEIGALAAGVTLAASPFAYEIASRMKPLRDFFIMLFFILLGSQVVFGQISMLFVPAAVLSIFVLVGNPLIMLILMNLLGYRTRTAFMAGLTVAQISEFSLILVALGYSFGHLSREVVSLVTLVGIITISGSTYLILYADQIYPRLKPILKLLTVRKSHAPEPLLGDNQADIVIFGYDRVGHDFVEAAREISQKYLVVDFNPRSIAWLAESKIPYRYGDAEDVEFLEETGVAKAQLVVSTIPDLKTNILLVNYYHSHNPTGIIMTISHSVENTKELYEAGASYVVMPHYLGASHAASLISKHRFDRGAFENEKARHLENLIKYEK
ncbi:MAG: Sodium/hydrogen exchanger [Parcubacteria group bacterium GW2011_GWD1_44_9]|nr:MAG: Sodium/hydrogen exchanger [Parcubacteria group bacterium GW2011_GWD1_44_9]